MSPINQRAGSACLSERTSLSATLNGTADFANTYAYDADQRLTMVQQQGVSGGDAVSQKEFDYGYNALGQFSSVVDYNFIGVGPRLDVLTGAYSYDNDARVTGIAYTSNAGATTIDTLGWGYDAANNVTSFASIDGEADYGYDPTNQLTSATYTTASGGHQPANESFSFDANGNRNMSGYSTGSGNLMSSDGTFNYQHDADGNTTARTRIATTYATDYRTTFTWDYRNRLTDVDYYDNSGVLTKHVHYVYGVFDHLLATEDDSTGSGQYGTIQHYVLDVSPEIPSAGVPGTALAQPLLQFDGSQTLTVRFLVGLDPTGNQAVEAQETVPSLSRGGPVVWAADDNLGTPRDEVDNTGALANHNVFSAFGQSVYSSDPAAVFWAGYAGGHFDPFTDLIDDFNRWRDPSSGKWLTNDPKGIAAGDAEFSRYAGNSPTTISDPTGLAPTFILPWMNRRYWQWRMDRKEAARQAVMQLSTQVQDFYVTVLQFAGGLATGLGQQYVAERKANIKAAFQPGVTNAQLAAIVAAQGKLSDKMRYLAQFEQWLAEQQELQVLRLQQELDQLKKQGN